MDHALIERPRRGWQDRMRSALVSWLGVPVELTNHAFWNEFTGGGANSGERVTVSTALRISAVWACVRLLAETISTLPLVLYRRTPVRAIAYSHPLYLILHDSPNADMTAVTFWETVLASMLLWGNAYALIHRAGGNVVALEFLRPEMMTWRRLSDGSIEYRWKNPNGQVQTASDADVLHIPAFTTDGLTGLSPVGYAVNVLGNAIAAERASGTVFRKGLMLSGTFKTANTIQEKHRDAFKARLEEYRGAMNAGNAPLLEAGIEYAPLAINPNDAQLLETRAFSIEEICRWYRVPPFMIGHSEKSTSWGTGIEQQMIGFLTFALRPWLKRIEQSVNRKLLGVLEQRDLYCEFNFEALLRADSVGRADYYAKMASNGIYTRNEIRDKENLPPMAGADELTAQVNLAPLAMLGKLAKPPDPAPPQQASPLNILVTMPEQKAPQVTMHHNTPINVRTPELRYSAPTINLAPAAINIAAPPAPNVEVRMPDVQVTTAPVTVNVPEQAAPRVTIHNQAPKPAEHQLPAFGGVEFTFDDDGAVTGAKLK